MGIVFVSGKNESCIFLCKVSNGIRLVYIINICVLIKIYCIIFLDINIKFSLRFCF